MSVHSTPADALEGNMQPWESLETLPFATGGAEREADAVDTCLAAALDVVAVGATPRHEDFAFCGPRSGESR
jgi:hypothetical protein